VEPALLPLLKPLAPLGVVENDQRVEGETDHIPFDSAGVPAFCFEQKQHSYANDHHAESDTLDKVIPAELQQAAQVLAFTAYGVADLAGPLPRQR
jgi:hypothetical protein